MACDVKHLDGVVDAVALHERIVVVQPAWRLAVCFRVDTNSYI